VVDYTSSWLRQQLKLRCVNWLLLLLLLQLQPQRLLLQLLVSSAMLELQLPWQCLRLLIRTGQWQRAIPHHGVTSLAHAIVFAPKVPDMCPMMKAWCIAQFDCNQCQCRKCAKRKSF